ncbi:unnamed protein product, partial [Timema podura]|nr:unnamed protein product [Timema podura]
RKEGEGLVVDGEHVTKEPWIHPEPSIGIGNPLAPEHCTREHVVYTITLTGEKLTLRLRRMLFAAMLRQEIAWFDEKANSSGALCARLSGDASQVQGATGQRLSIIIQSIATFLLAVGLAMYYEWRLGLVGLAFSPVIMAAQYYFIVVQSGEFLNKREAMEQAIQVNKSLL